MSTTTRWRVTGATLSLTVALTGCAGTGDSPRPQQTPPTTPGPTTGMSRTDPPVPPPPSAPPKTPSDRILTNGWVVGTVVRGGSGPCYRLTTDDGDEYAMYSEAGLTLTHASRIRVRVTPAEPRVDCGPGRQVRLDVAEPLG